MSKFYSFIIFIFILYHNAYGLEIVTPSISGNLPIKSWKAFRDDRVVKQDLDYSCGAASLATILKEFYNIPVTEKQILNLIKKRGNDGVASFKDLKSVAEQFGFKAIGVALDFEKLQKLKIPAIAYVIHRERGHFSTIRGIGRDGTILLADPSWGNRKFTKEQFIRLWMTREDKKLYGKLLLILPDKKDSKKISNDFFKKLDTLNSLSVGLLSLKQ